MITIDGDYMLVIVPPLCSSVKIYLREIHSSEIAFRVNSTQTGEKNIKKFLKSKILVLCTSFQRSKVRQTEKNTVRGENTWKDILTVDFSIL